MRKLKALLLAAFLTSPVYAEDVLTGVIGPFGGLNNSDNSLIIPSNQAQDLLNVDITPGGKSVKKREGYATALTLGITTAAVHGTHIFYDSSGNDIVLAFNDTRMTASVSGGSATLLMSSATAAQTWQCVDSQGYAYCAGTSRQWIIKTQGTTWSQLSGFTATGTIVAVTPERLVQAGFSGSNSNRIDFSKANDFTTWTVGSEPTDPITFTITSPGSKITHLVYAHKKIYWFKESSFGYILEGEELTDWQIKIVSSDIGTLDNTSTQDTDGNLYFRGQDGHIYVTDGGSVTKLSKDIEGTIQNSSPRVGGSVTLTSGSDWAAGTFSGNTVYADTVTVSGNIQTTFPDSFDSLRDGASGTKQVWQKWTDLSSTVSTASVTGSKLKINYTSGSGFPYYGVRTASKLGSLSAGTTLHFRLDSYQYSGGIYYLALATHVASGSNAINDLGTSSALLLRFDALTSTCTRLSGGQMIGGSVPTLTSAAFPIPCNVDVWLATTAYSITMGGTTVFSGSHAGTGVGSNNYAYLIARHSSSGVSSDYYYDNFSVAPQTFTFTSASQSVPATISAWDSFDVTKNETGGVLAFAARSSAASPYTALSAGAVPTFNTSTYWQVLSTVTFSDITYGNPTSISDMTQNYFEGNGADKSYATFFDDKIMFSVPNGDNQSTNNRVLIFDTTDPHWTVYDWAVNGFYERNQRLYFGSAAGGYVYKYGGTDSDNGTAIESYWKSKDFFMDSPFLDKEFSSISIAGDTVANSSVTVTYTTNGSSSTSFTAAMGNNNTYARTNKTLPLGKIGGTLNIQFGNDASDQPFEIFALSYAYRLKSWKPEP